MQPENDKNYWQPETPDEAPSSTLTEPSNQPAATPAPTPSEPFIQESQPVIEEPAEPTPAIEPITWTAQEYIHIDKGPGWFILFVVVVLGLIAIDIFLLRSYTFSALVIVMAIATVIYVRRPPRSLTYALSPDQGLYIGEKLHHLDEFRAFGLIKDGEHFSVMLIPRKRFAPGVSVFFPDEAGERIVDILGTRLPMENLKLDVIDVVIRKLRL